MTTPLAQHRAREAQHAAQRADQTQRQKRVIETTTTSWWPENNPTRCLSCGAEHKPGQELACGH